MRKFIRSFKLSYKIFNFFKKSQLIHNLPHYKKYGLTKKYYSAVSSEDFIGIESPLNLYDAHDSATEMPKQTGFKALDESVKSKLLPWSSEGYVVLDAFFSEQEVDAFNKEVVDLLEKKKVKFRYQNKIMFAIRDSVLLRNAGDHKKLLNILNVLLGKKVNLFQSINFLTGSQQHTHSDSIHMSTFPYGNLIAIWIALEDITADCGPLHYYPGSHKLPYMMNGSYGNAGTNHRLGKKNYADYTQHIQSVITKNNLTKKIFLAKKGDVFIWHANLLHGGEKVTNSKSSRKSMVFHYYSTDAICFYEVTQRPTLK